MEEHRSSTARTDPRCGSTTATWKLLSAAAEWVEPGFAISVGGKPNGDTGGELGNGRVRLLAPEFQSVNNRFWLWDFLPTIH